MMATVEAVRFEPFGAAHSADRRDLASPLQLLRRRKLVIAGVMLANRLRDVSELQDCLMTHATNCGDPAAQPAPIGAR